MRSVIFILMVVGFAFSCSEKQENEIVDLKKITLDKEIKEEVREAKNIFKHLYLPIEMSNMFDEMNLDFDPSLLRNPSEGDKIVFSNEIAMAMGAFGVDLGYVRLHEQWSMANYYFQTIKSLSEKIGISEKVFEHLSSYFDRPVYEKDTLEILANEVYLITDYNLRQNARERASALIILGGWLEALKIGLEIYNDTKNEKMLQRICEQEKSLNSVVNLLIVQYEDDLLNVYTEQLYEMQNLFHGMNAAYRHYISNEDTYSDEAIENYIDKIDRILKRFLDFAL